MTNDAGKLKIAAAGDRAIVMTRQFRAPCGMVFEAWTKPELVRRWLLGPEGWILSVCEIDLRVGGAYRYEWFKEKTGERMGMGGEYREIVPGQRIVATEKFDTSWYPGGAVVTTRFDESSGMTTVETTVTYDSHDAREMVLRSPMESGVEAGYQRLESLIEARFA